MYAEYYKLLMKEIKDDLMNGETSLLWIERLNVVTIPILTNIISFIGIPTEIPVRCFYCR